MYYGKCMNGSTELLKAEMKQDYGLGDMTSTDRILGF